jgi:hypothetical protein
VFEVLSITPLLELNIHSTTAVSDFTDSPESLRELAHS